MEQELKQAFANRKNAKSGITRVETFLRTNESTLLHKYDYIHRLELLESSYSKFSVAQDCIEELETDVDKIENRSDIEDRYFSLKTKLRILIDKCSTEVCNTNVQSSLQNSAHNTSSKMPEIVIEKFTGAHQNWSSFYDIFKALVLNNSDLAEIQKLIYLKSNLQGEPLKLIENLPLVADNLQVAINILKERYENKLASIYSHIKGLLELPSINRSNSSNLRDFVVSIKQHTECLKNLSVPVAEWNLILVYVLSQKLDINTRRGYELERGPTCMPTLVDFLNFVEKRCQAAENLSSPEPLRKSAHFAERQFSCLYCKLPNHNIFKCQKFRDLTVSQRKQFVYTSRLCFKCFGSHPVKECTLKNCPICGETHNSLLHIDSSNKSGFKNKVQNDSVNFKPVQQNSNSNSRFKLKGSVSLDNPSTSANNASNTQTSEQTLNTNNSNVQNPKSSLFVSQNSFVLLATAVVQVVNNDGVLIPARAVLDNGSQVSLITHRLARQLNYPTYRQNVSIFGVSGKMQCNESIDINFISNIDKSKKFKVTCSVTDFITSKLPQYPIDTNTLDIPNSIVLADPKYYLPQHADLLLGSDVYFSLLVPGLINRGNEFPVLQNTHLGWVIGGFLSSSLISNLITRCDPLQPLSLFINSSQVDDLLQRFWSLEEVPKDNVPSNEDQYSETIFTSTTKILENGRFQVNIPLKSSSENLKLGESFSLAKKRFLSLEKRLHQNTNLFKQYSEFIDEYVTLGHARYVPLDLKNHNNDHKYFIPHHCIIREDKSSTRLRVVFDASMKTTSGYSLNDICLKGFVVQPELFDILCRFRTFKFALVADIEKMYRQILTNPDQNYLQNILWRKNPNDDLLCIELLTVSYGTNFAPYIATRCLIELANIHEDIFPFAADTLKNQTYVDDVLGGGNSQDELYKLRDQLINLLKLGKFRLHKWCSNSEEFMQKFGSESELTNYSIVSESSSNKILGIYWNPKLDCFSISLPKNININPITKRNVLAVIAQIYDPLGFVAPIVVNAKIFMQKLWLAKLSWDEGLNQELKCEWFQFAKNISELSDLTIPRCIINNMDIKRIEIHGYADSSLFAYGCCIYLRIVYRNENVSCNLICSKSKVSPLRTVSLPRLELCACLMLAQTTKRILEIYKDSFYIDSVNLWSDSKISLAWLQSHPSKWNIFVSNRVSIIQECTSHCVWRYIPSKENPADHVSRGLTAQELISNKLWWNGPHHLQNSSFDLDLFKIQLEIFEKFSDFYRLQRVIALCLRFSKNLKCSKGERIFSPLKVDELQISLCIIIQILQQKYFSEEIDALKNSKVLRNKQLRSLNPFLDDKGIMRVGGRLLNADIPFSQKHPILLPARCHVVNTMLRREHLKLYHAGPQTVLSNFRLRYWPIDGLRAVKRIIHSCVTCFRFRAKCGEQIMANLPKDRVSIVRPFLKVGVDFGGPYWLKTSNLRRSPKVKAYIAIFVCMVTKCVHIELVSGLSTEHFLLTLKRFIGRRGNPSIIYSDNATNFLGSSNQLKELHDFFKSKSNIKTIETFLSQNEIQWKFIPPRSPHWGGIWEAAIKSAKHHILRTIGDTPLNFEEFSTVLTSIESIMNSRPLSVLSNDPSDLNPLTPGHFLIGDSLAAYPDKDLTNITDNRLSIYQKCVKIKQQFWKRWSVEYLNRLQHRPKWSNPSRNLKINEVVLVKEENLPPLKWSLARIIDIPHSPDGKPEEIANVVILSTCPCQMDLHYVITTDGRVTEWAQRSCNETEGEPLPSVSPTVGPGIAYKFNFSFTVHSVMAPVSQLLVYYVTSQGEPVSDVMSFDVKLLHRQVYVNLEEREWWLPNQSLDLEVVAEPSSLVCLLGSRSASGGDIRFDPRISEEHLPAPITGEVDFLEAGLSFFQRQCIKRSDSGVSAVSYRQRGSGAGPSSRRRPPESLVGGAPFEQLWLWSCFNYSSDAPSTSLTISAPKESGKWSLWALTVSSAGLRFSAPVQVQVFRPLQVEFHLPPSLKVRETLEVDIKIGNNINSCMDVTALLALSEGAQFLSNGLLYVTERLRLGPHGATSLVVRLLVTTPGLKNMTVEVNGYTSSSCEGLEFINNTALSGAVVHSATVKVDPEGTVKTDTESAYFCANENVVISTVDNYKYEWIQAPRNRESIVIEVKTSKSKRLGPLHIALAESKTKSDKMYRISVGDADNTISYIARGKRGYGIQLTSADTPAILSEDHWRTFWITWDHGTICFGNGSQPRNNTLLKWRMDKKIKIHQIGFASSWGALAEFRVWNFNEESGFSQVLNLDTPKNVVPGSEWGELIVTGGLALPQTKKIEGGGLMGALAALTPLLALQHMGNNRVNETEKEEIMASLPGNIQSILAFRKEDNSFSEHQMLGSHRITVSILEVLTKVQPYFNVDPDLIQSVKRWVQLRQEDDGRFSPLDADVKLPSVHGMHTTKKNLTSEAVRFENIVEITAETVIALYEIGVETDADSDTLQKAKIFLENSLPNVESPETIATVTLALVLARSATAAWAIEKLRNASTTEDGEFGWPHFMARKDAANWLYESEAGKTLKEPMIATVDEYKASLYALSTFCLIGDLRSAESVTRFLFYRSHMLDNHRELLYLAVKVFSQYESLAKDQHRKLTISIATSGMELTDTLELTSCTPPQTLYLPSLPTKVFVYATGAGCATTQGKTTYSTYTANIKTPLLELWSGVVEEILPDRSSVEEIEGKLPTLKIKTCFRWKGTTPSAVLRLEVSLFSGFGLTTTPPQLLTPVKMAEMQHGNHANKLWFIFANISTSCPVCVQYTCRSPFVISSLRPAHARIFPASREDLGADIFFHTRPKSSLLHMVTADDMFTWFGVNNTIQEELHEPDGCKHQSPSSSSATTVPSSTITSVFSSRSSTATELTTINDDFTTMPTNTLAENITIAEYTIINTTSFDSTTAAITESQKSTLSGSNDVKATSTFVPLTTESSTETPERLNETTVKEKGAVMVSETMLKDNIIPLEEEIVKSTLPITEGTPNTTHTKIPVIISKKMRRNRIAKKAEAKIFTPSSSNRLSGVEASNEKIHEDEKAIVIAPKHVNTEHIHTIPVQLKKDKSQYNDNDEEVITFAPEIKNDQYVLLDKEALWGMLKEAVDDEFQKTRNNADGRIRKHGVST